MNFIFSKEFTYSSTNSLNSPDIKTSSVSSVQALQSLQLHRSWGLTDYFNRMMTCLFQVSLSVLLPWICAQDYNCTMHLILASQLRLLLTFLDQSLNIHDSLTFPHVMYHSTTCPIVSVYFVLNLTFCMRSRKISIFTFIVYRPPFGDEYFLTKIRLKSWHPNSTSSFASSLLGPIQFAYICSDCHIIYRVDQAQLDVTFRINIQNPMVPLRLLNSNDPRHNLNQLSLIPSYNTNTKCV